MVPDVLPRVGEEIAQRLVVGLAGQNIAIRFNAHVIKRRSAALDSQTAFNGIEMAVKRGCVPDQALTGMSDMVFRDLQQASQVRLRDLLVDRLAAP